MWPRSHKEVALLRSADEDSGGRPSLSLRLWRRGEPHSCGLSHRSGCDIWSPMGAILWWMLKTPPADAPDVRKRADKNANARQKPAPGLQVAVPHHG